MSAKVRKQQTRAPRSARPKPAAVTRGDVAVIPTQLAALPATLQADYGEFLGIAAQVNELALRSYRRIGRLVHNWKNDRAVYGASAVEQVAKISGWSVGVLYKAENLYDRISEQEFDAWLVARSATNGAPLSWTHAAILVTVEDPRQRQDLFERVMRQGLTVAQLEEQVRALRGVTSLRPGSGRKFALVADTARLRGNFNAVVEDVLRRAANVWAPALVTFENRAPALPDLADLDAALQRNAQLQAAAAELGQKMLALRNTYAQRLNQPVIEMAGPPEE